MKKITRSDIPKFSEEGLTRVVPCNLAYTQEEYAAICAGHLAVDDIYHIFAEGDELYFVDHPEKKLAYKAAFERRGAGWVLARISLEGDDASRQAFPGDIDAAWLPWMLIEQKLLQRFPDEEWQAYMEDFRVTPEVDDPGVPMTAYDRSFIFACRTFFKKHANTI